MQWIRWFKELTIDDVPLVGGKNASLGEMIRELTPKGIAIPNGFAITAAKTLITYLVGGGSVVACGHHIHRVMDDVGSYPNVPPGIFQVTADWLIIHPHAVLKTIHQPGL